MKRCALRPTAIAVSLVLSAMSVLSCSNDPTTPQQTAVPYRIAFLSDRDGNSEIYTIRSDGADQKRLTANSVVDRTISWSPDGLLIAFLSDRTGVYEIWIMHADGLFPTQLTHSTQLMGEVEAVPAWSPDGSRIAFCSARDGDQEIYVMNVDGSDQRNVTLSPESADYGPAWRPDGLIISYVSEDSQTLSICDVNTDGTVRDCGNFYRTDVPRESPSWAPLGARIAWLEHATAGDFIVVCSAGVNSSSCDAKSVTDASAPAWSPDGAALIYARSNENGRDIYRLDAATMTETRLTTSAPGTESRDPAWSPDGAEIVFSSNRSGDYEIYVMNADGTDVRRLTNSAGADAFPTCAVITD